jgi:hypothetical protein
MDAARSQRYSRGVADDLVNPSGSHSGPAPKYCLRGGTPLISLPLDAIHVNNGSYAGRLQQRQVVAIRNIHDECYAGATGTPRRSVRTRRQTV